MYVCMSFTLTVCKLSFTWQSCDWTSYICMLCMWPLLLVNMIHSWVILHHLITYSSHAELQTQYPDRKTKYKPLNISSPSQYFTIVPFTTLARHLSCRRNSVSTLFKSFYGHILTAHLTSNVYRKYMACNIFSTFHLYRQNWISPC